MNHYFLRQHEYERKPLKNNDFRLFLDIWNTTQKYTTPSIHLDMGDWLQTCYLTGEKRLLLMAFRASGKSTLVGLFSAWLLWQDPDMRILVLAADTSLASKMVRNIRKIIEKHPLTTHLKPTKLDQWSSDRFTIKRKKELRDPSVLAAGVTTNITGCRADFIIYDDVEVPNTSNSAEKRQSLRERLKESNFILVPGGSQLYIGTPHSYFSIYADKPRTEIDEEEIFLMGFERYEQSLIDKNNKSAWPEQFSDEDIKLLKRQVGPNRFSSQMMLQPLNIEEGRLDCNLLNFYEADLEYTESQRKAQLGLMDNRIVSCSAWWDPSFGSAKGDSSVLAIIFTDEDGYYYLHHISYIEVEAKEGEDEASLQCKIVADIAKQFYVPSIAIETNGIGKFLPSILRRELEKNKVPCAVIEKTSSQAKYIRIIESFDAVMAARALFVHESVKNTPFLTEMMEWQPKRKNSKDDGLDAVAGALSLEPVRIKRSYSTIKRKWQGSGYTHQAKSDFDV